MLKKSLLLTAVLAGMGSLIAAQQSARPPASSTTTTVAAAALSGSVSVQPNIEYGTQNGEKLLLDIYQPAETSSRPVPAVVLIHGGSWSGGDKGSMHGMGNFLARSGYVAISVNYRLLHGNEDRWPAQLDDVQRAVRWLRANAAKYNVDGNHIGAFGHSAGAQLAALLGMEDTRDNSDATLAKYSSRVQAVVDVSGPIDFVVLGDPHGGGELVPLFGGEYQKIPIVWRDASPAYHVEKSNAPFLIVHGTQDNIVPMEQAQELYDKLQQAGVSVSLIKVDDGHTFTLPEARHRLALESLTFFNRNLVVSLQ